MKPRNRRLIAALSCCLLWAACGADPAPAPRGDEVVPGLAAGTLRLGDELTLQVQIADTQEAQSRGLMEVESMPARYGLVFVWSETGRHSFYMKNTLIPLDIAWWNDQMRIVDIQTMTPCEADPCPTYSPATDHIAAVEVNAGVLEEAGIEVGDRVELVPEAGL